MDKIRLLECLSGQYPTIDSAATEIINLQSILNLPKGTEHFLSDIRPRNGFAAWNISNYITPPSINKPTN